MSEVLTNGIKVPDKGSRAWYDDMRGDLVKLDALIGSASGVTVNPIITSGIEIASITINGTSYSLYQQDGGIAVNIKPVTTNEELPILLSKSAEENTDTVDMSVGVTVNPSSNTVTATTFVGDLSGNATSATTATNATNATTATSATKATQDASGNVITTTYATKVENSTKANSSDLTSHTTNNNIHVTSSDKSNWNNKSNFSGSYNDLTNKPTVPTKVSDLTNDSGFITSSDLSDNLVTTNTAQTITGAKSIDSDCINLIDSTWDYTNTTDASHERIYRFSDKTGMLLGGMHLGQDTSNNRYLSLLIKDGDGANSHVAISSGKAMYPSEDNTFVLGLPNRRWANVYATTITASILNIPQNGMVSAFSSSAVNNGSTVAGTTLKVANGGTGGAFTATTETLTGTYRALNTVDANGVGMFAKIA